MVYNLVVDRDKKAQKERRREKRAEMHHQRPTDRAVAAHGDTSIKSSLKGFAAFPKKVCPLE